jgi:hypothetical protein
MAVEDCAVDQAVLSTHLGVLAQIYPVAQVRRSLGNRVLGMVEDTTLHYGSAPSK